MDRFAGMSMFVAVAEAGSLVKAAERLDLSPPAVTRGLAALETRLGCRLLNRTTRKLSLTEEGARYLEDCRRILQDLREAEESLRGGQSQPQGVVRLTAPVLFGQLYVMPILRDFLDRYPHVQARVTLVDRVVNLQEEGHDLAVRLGELPDSALFATPVGRVRRVVCASPEYLAVHGRPDSPGDLLRHRLITTEGERTAWRFASQTVRLDPTLVVNSNQAAVEAAVAGWGITRLLSYQVSAPVSSGALDILLTDHERPPWPIHVVHHEGARPASRVRALLDFLTTRLRNLHLT